MPSSLYCSGMIPKGLHGRRMCIQKQVFRGLLYLVLGSWGTASPTHPRDVLRRFFVRLPAESDFALSDTAPVMTGWPLFCLVASGGVVFRGQYVS
jgi:hypothetical protein